MIDPTASDCKKVTRYVNTASDIKPPSDKLPSNNPSVKAEPVQKPSLQASTKITVKVSYPSLLLIMTSYRKKNLCRRSQVMLFNPSLTRPRPEEVLLARRSLPTFKV